MATTIVSHRRLGPDGVAPLLMAAGFLFLVLLGGTEAGRVSTALRTAGGLVGATAILFYLRQMPRQNDLGDRLVLAGLLLFLVTCVTSSDSRASFEAATTALAYVAAFYLARGAVAGRRGGEMAITVLGSVGIILGLAYLILWGAIWLRWTTIPGAGLPPFDLRLPTYLYRHQYLVGMLGALLLPATLLLARRPTIWPLALIGAVATFTVAFLSGGRAIWVAGVAAVAIAVVAALMTAQGVPGRFNRRSFRIAALVVIAGLVVIVAAPFVSRLAATSTIDLRLNMWQTAISHWLDSVIVGFGPGTFQREFSLTGYYSRFEPNAPHAHNVAVQVLFEGGIVGLVGLGLVCAGVVAGILQHRRTHWASTAALAFIAVVSVADNPAVVPFLIGPLIAWAAVASPRAASADPGRRKAVDRNPSTSAEQSPGLAPDPGRRKGLQVLTLAAATIAAGATLATYAAAWAFDRARDAAPAGEATDVVANLSAAVALDPAFALYHRELGVWLEAEGHHSAARAQLTTAIRLNPADAQARRAAALLNASDGAHDEAVALASSLVVLQATHVENALTLAYVSGVFEDWVGQHSALVAAVRFAPWLTAAPEWSLAFPKSDRGRVLDDANLSWQGDDELSTRNLKAQAWLAGLVGTVPPQGTTQALQAQASVLACRMDEARQEIASMVGPPATELETLEARFLLGRADEGGAPGDVEALIRLRDPGLAGIISHQAIGVSPVWSFFYDNRYYDRQAIFPPAGPVLPTPASGLSAWLRNPLVAADRGAPDSGLAKCR